MLDGRVVRTRARNTTIRTLVSRISRRARVGDAMRKPGREDGCPPRLGAPRRPTSILVLVYRTNMYTHMDRWMWKLVRENFRESRTAP